MIRRVALRLLAFPDWLYSPRAAGFDLGLGLLAFGWGSLMLLKPTMFDAGTYVGMTWLPDAVWITLMFVISGLHLGGLLCPLWKAVRVTASLLSSWTWFFVSLSLARVEINTGVIAYGLNGWGALFAAIYLAGLPSGRNDPCSPS